MLGGGGICYPHSSPLPFCMANVGVIWPPICSFFLWYRRTSPCLVINSFSPLDVGTQACHFLHRQIWGLEVQLHLIDNKDGVPLAPKLGQLKLNVDTATFTDQQATGLGVVVRDAHGQYVEWCSKILDWPFNAGSAEALTVKLALEICRDDC